MQRPGNNRTPLSLPPATRNPAKAKGRPLNRCRRTRRGARGRPCTRCVRWFSNAADGCNVCEEYHDLWAPTDVLCCVALRCVAPCCDVLRRLALWCRDALRRVTLRCVLCCNAIRFDVMSRRVMSCDVIYCEWCNVTEYDALLFDCCM